MRTTNRVPAPEVDIEALALATSGRAVTYDDIAGHGGRAPQ